MGHSICPVGKSCLHSWKEHTVCVMDSDGSLQVKRLEALTVMLCRVHHWRGFSFLIKSFMSMMWKV